MGRKPTRVVERDSRISFTPTPTRTPSALFSAAATAKHLAHDNMGPVNPLLGVHGYPDCVNNHPISDDIEANLQNLECAQRGAPTALKIACVGDSITAGAHASNSSMAYPQQLQVRPRVAARRSARPARTLTAHPNPRAAHARRDQVRRHEPGRVRQHDAEERGQVRGAAPSRAEHRARRKAFTSTTRNRAITYRTARTGSAARTPCS